MMKVAYLGKIQLSDVDLSYLHEAQKIVDITYFMEVSPRFLQGPAFNIRQLYPKSGIFKAAEIYPEFKKYADFIDINKFYVVNTCGRFWLLKSFWTHLLLLCFLLRGHFNVIHLCWPPNLYEFILYFLRKRMMLTVHDPFPHSGLDTAIVRFRRKVAFCFVPRLVILNKAQQQEFINYYHVAPERIISSRLSCYTYLQTVVPDTELVGRSDRYILFVGKISPYKGLDYLLPAMKQAHCCCPDCRLVVAGGGAYYFDITEYKNAAYIDIRNRFIPESELVALIAGAAFVVCPYTDATQSGVIMSAFAFNKPVLATNVGGLPEMVKHQHYGLIVKEKDIDELVDGIVSLWQQPERLSSYATEIKRDYSAGPLSWQRVAEEMFSEYCKVTQ